MVPKSQNIETAIRSRSQRTASDIESRNVDRSDGRTWLIATRNSSRFEVSAHRPRGNAEKTVGDHSGGVAVVIPQQPTESFATLDLAGHCTDFFTRLDQLIVESLVISL